MEIAVNNIKTAFIHANILKEVKKNINMVEGKMYKVS